MTCSGKLPVCAYPGSVSHQPNECLPPAESLWDVYVVSATVDSTTGDGSAWDPFGGLPDLYVTVATQNGLTPAVVGVTPVVDDTVAGAWTAPIARITAELLNETFRLQLFDEDTVGKDWIGECGTYLTSSGETIRDWSGAVHQCVGTRTATRAGFTISYRIVPAP